MVLEYSIIKTMDTSGMGIMQGRKSKPIAAAGNITQDELTAILKFGAKNLFKNDAVKNEDNWSSPSGKPKDIAAVNHLETMNLDDILARAEVHEGTEQSGTALGSEEFLNQFHISDVAVNQLSWDELIPEHLRDKVDSNDIDGIPEELLLEGRRRATSVSYIGAELKLTAPKRKRKKTIQSPAYSELDDKEVKHLIRGLLKFGDIMHRYDIIAADADITHKDRDIVMKCTEGIIKSCTSSCSLVSNQTLDTKGKPKVITSGYHGITIANAQQLIQRVEDLSVLSKRLVNQPLKSFRVPWSSKPITNWSATWGAKDDSMLLVGIYKHGFGSWEAMQEDPDLPFLNKFFLNQHDKQLPKGVHLTRRGEVLLRSLNEHEIAKGSVDHTSSTGKLVPKPSSSDPQPQSSVKKKSPSAFQKGPRREPEKRAPKEKAEPVKRQSSAKPSRKVNNEDDSSSYESMDESKCKNDLRPIKKELKFLLKPPSDIQPKEKAQLIKTHLTTVGKFIRSYCSTIKSVSLMAKTESHLWKFASYFWPTKISSRQIKDLYTRIVTSVTKKVVEGKNNMEDRHTPGENKD
jgi:chromodomain-helicase-DNA-binding protein 1